MYRKMERDNAGTKIMCVSDSIFPVIELDDGKIYRKALYLMVKTMVSCRFSPTNQSNDYGTKNGSEAQALQNVSRMKSRPLSDKALAP